jgi:uncharacterized delta-60 repeat protein
MMRGAVGRSAIACALIIAMAGPAQATPGDLDPSFDGGVVSQAITSATGYARAVDVASDGSVLACGYADDGIDIDLVLMRWTETGLPDASFGGGDGIVRKDLGADETCAAVKILGSGKILAAGSWDLGRIFVARLRPSGALDHTFGVNGRRHYFLGPGANIGGLTTRASGKILLGGSGGTRLFAMRLRRDGDLDSTFGHGDGIVRLRARTADEGFALAVQPDGRILVGGDDLSTGDQYRFLIARFTANGVVDTSFSTNGWTELDWTPGDDEAYGLAVTGTGRIIAVGFASVGPGSSDLAIARFLPHGKLDGTFGVGGKVQTDVLGGSDAARGVVRQGKKFLIAGYTSAGTADIVVARYLSGGDPDSTFGGGDGVVTTDVSGAFDVGFAIARSQGSVVVAGVSDWLGTRDFAAARYLLT